MKDKNLKVLTIRYDAEIAQHEVPLFRGAVIATMKDKANTLYHNHLDDEKYRYSYPLIQYKRIGGRPAIVCVDEGADVIAQFMAEGANKFRLGEREVEMSVDDIKPRQVLVQVWKDTFQYSLRRWIPLNADNYVKFQQMDSIIERVQLLERILKGNILSFAKGIGVTVEDQIEVKIKSVTEPFLVKHKGHSMMAFDVEFGSNFSLPDFVGLGKNVSIGFGVVKNEKIETK